MGQFALGPTLLGGPAYSVKKEIEITIEQSP